MKKNFLTLTDCENILSKMTSKFLSKISDLKKYNTIIFDKKSKNVFILTNILLWIDINKNIIQ